MSLIKTEDPGRPLTDDEITENWEKFEQLELTYEAEQLHLAAHEGPPMPVRQPYHDGHGNGPMTPWGSAQAVYEIADGIQLYTTASHGGLKLSPERVKALPPDYTPFNTSKEWAEEDGDAGKVLDHFGIVIDWENNPPTYRSLM